MELNQLYCFRAVAETQNMTEAAEKLHVTQPTLSKVIKRLEDDLGVKLFDRRASHLRLNPYGSAYLVYVNQALDSLERGQQYLNIMTTGENMCLRLASTFLGMPTILVEQFVQLHPELSIVENINPPEDILGLLLNGHTDFALTLFPLDHPMVEQIISIREPLLLALPQTMEVPGEYVRLADYQTSRFAIFESGKDLNDSILRCCGEANFVPNIVYRSSRCQIVHQMVDDLGVCTLLPAHLVMQYYDQLPPEAQCRIRMVDEPKCYRKICLSCLQTNKKPTPERETFADFGIRFFKNIEAEISEKLMRLHR